MRQTCQVRGCKEYRVGQGLCRKHYMRLRRTGSTSDVRRNARGICSKRGCSESHTAKGLCRRHWQEQYDAPRREQRRAETRARLPELVCAYCGRTFTPTRYRDGRNRFCSRTCKERARLADGRASLSVRKSYFKRRYNLTLEQVEEMAAKGCAICGTTTWNGHRKRPHVDHDHKTGRVRGVLCSECNTGLGKFKDDPVLLRAAARFLR